MTLAKRDDLSLTPWNFSGSAPVTEDKRSDIINGAASEEISGQYFAAIRRNIDHVDAQ
jgi:hypothetical protein